MKNRNCSNFISNILVIIILILYTLFLYIDFYNLNVIIGTEYIKYLCILLCFLLSIFSTRNLVIGTNAVKVNHRDIVLLQFAMSFTVIADLCLVIIHLYRVGVVFFCFVQITYYVRYTNDKIKTTISRFFIIFMLIVCLYFIGNIFIIKITTLIPLSLFYLICLLSSVIKAMNVWKNNLYPSPSKYMIVFGMLLFLLCDICVALYNTPVLLQLTGNFIIRFQQITGFLIWAFYVPSQLLLSLSGSIEIKR